MKRNKSIRKTARKAICAALLLAAFSVSSGCQELANMLPRMSEISDFEVIQVLGIDKSSRNPDEIEVTVVAEVDSAPGAEGGAAQPETQIISASAPTSYEALSRMNILTDKRQHFGYIDFLLIGETAAKEDLAKYLDFFTRDHESRHSTNVFIIRDMSAREFLAATATAKRSIADALRNFDETIDVLSGSEMLRAIDVINMLDTEGAAAVIPALRCEEALNERVVGATISQVFAPAGYAILLDARLVDYLDVSYACGYNVLMEQMHMSPVGVLDSSGARVAVELIQERMTFETVWDGKTLKRVSYKIVLEGNIEEQLGRNDIFEDAELRYISARAAEVVKAEIDNVLAKTRKVGRDLLGIGERVRMKNPVRWARIEDEWRTLFPEVEITAEVTCVLRHPYNIREPNGFKGDENWGSL